MFKSLLDVLLKLIGKGSVPETLPSGSDKILDKEHVKQYEQENKNTKKNKPLQLPVEFKTERVAGEFETLKDKNDKLRQAVVECNRWCNQKFGKNLTLTMIYRTQAEQDYLYRNNARYQRSKFKSPHQFWQAVDLRSRNFSEKEITEIENWFNSRYDGSNYYDWTARCHDVGAGRHFHVQYLKHKKPRR
jgi:hypothetical protein